MCKVDWLEVKKNFPELLMYKVDWLEVEKNFPKVLVYKGQVFSQETGTVEPLKAGMAGAIRVTSAQRKFSPKRWIVMRSGLFVPGVNFIPKEVGLTSTGSLVR